MAREFNLEIDDSINEVIDETPGNSFIALRRLRWSAGSDFKLDIRKWFVNADGTEVAGKGVAFVTEEGPDNLINALLRHGYGNTRKTLDGIKDRDDFLVTVKAVLDENHMDINSVEVQRTVLNGSETFYDPKSIIG